MKCVYPDNTTKVRTEYPPDISMQLYWHTSLSGLLRLIQILPPTIQVCNKWQYNLQETLVLQDRIITEMRTL